MLDEIDFSHTAPAEAEPDHVLIAEGFSGRIRAVGDAWLRERRRLRAKASGEEILK
jgi:hypothetical protein